MADRGGFPNPAKRERARILLEQGKSKAALKLLEGSCYGAGYDCDYFELLGRALLACSYIQNAGCFLFLCGIRQPEYIASINQFLAQNSDPKNFRQLQSQFPERVKVLWKLKQFPPIVALELRALGWPEDTQAAIITRTLQKKRQN